MKVKYLYAVIAEDKDGNETLAAINQGGTSWQVASLDRRLSEGIMHQMKSAAKDDSKALKLVRFDYGEKL